MSITIVDLDSTTEVELGDHTIQITTLEQRFLSSGHGSLSGLGDNDHPQYMQHLIYDPSGKTSNVFDLTNHTGSLDAGTFN